MKAAVVGAAGYVGGELLRLLIGHPDIELVQATSDTHSGAPLHSVHPNLRSLTSLKYSRHDSLQSVDVVFLARPAGIAAKTIDDTARRAKIIVDLSADFRNVIRPPRGSDGQRHDQVEGFVVGLPELYRRQLRGAKRISVPGCMATAAILTLQPLAAAGLLVGTEIIVDARTGSSGAGTTPGPASHHADRAGVLRVYAPTGHRHATEIEQACGIPVRMTVTAVDAVRGVQVIIHIRPSVGAGERALWDLYREHYDTEPFVRLVNSRSGIYRLPEPKLLAGTNFCDLGFAVDIDGERAVLIGALDNLGKGAAGNALQSLNVAAGLEETAGLLFAGLHPV